MENTLQIAKGDKLMHVFDLKGSTVDREASPDSSTLKDINLVKMREYDANLTTLPKSRRNTLISTINDDVDFLCELGIMDYSLLLAVVEKAPTKAADLSLNLSKMSIASLVSENNNSSMSR